MGVVVVVGQAEHGLFVAEGDFGEDLFGGAVFVD